MIESPGSFVISIFKTRGYVTLSRSLLTWEFSLVRFLIRFQDDGKEVIVVVVEVVVDDGVIVFHEK